MCPVPLTVCQAMVLGHPDPAETQQRKTRRGQRARVEPRVRAAGLCVDGLTMTVIQGKTIPELRPKIEARKTHCSKGRTTGSARRQGRTQEG